MFSVPAEPHDEHGEEAEGDEDDVEDEEHAVEDQTQADPVLVPRVRPQVLLHLLLDGGQVSAHVPQLLQQLLIAQVLLLLCLSLLSLQSFRTSRTSRLSGEFCRNILSPAFSNSTRTFTFNDVYINLTAAL